MKIAKLSLVAAIAVAGLSTANAQPLEEAIKNVEVSGSVVYRYNDSNNDASNLGVPVTNNKTATTNNYKVGLNLSSKVNEDVKFNSRFLVANADGNFAAAGLAAGLDTQAEGDSNVDVELSQAYFAYTGLANTTVNVGKQGLTTPWTVAVDSDGAEQTGTGVLALSTVGPVTLAAAYFNQTNLQTSGDHVATLNAANSVPTSSVGSFDIATVGAIANLGPVTVDAWYLNLDEMFDSYTVGAKSDLDLSGVKLGVDARYASLTLDDLAARTAGLVNAVTNDVIDNNAMGKIALTAKAGIVSGKVAYGWTDKDGGLTAIDNDANTTLLGWNLNMNNRANADYYQAVLGFDILSNLNLSANYGNLEWTPAVNTTREQEEIYAQLSYKMSKNLNGYVRYGLLTDETKTVAGTTENADTTTGRLQVEYTF